MQEEQLDEYFDGLVKRPLLNWTEAQVYDFLESKGVPPNPLYGLGYGRVGCFPCIHANKKELQLLPDWAWDKLQEWEDVLGRSWFAAGKLPGMEPKHIPTIDEVRQWSRTSHGGSQFNLFGIEQKDSPACMSTWGQCE